MQAGMDAGGPEQPLPFEGMCLAGESGCFAMQAGEAAGAPRAPCFEGMHLTRRPDCRARQAGWETAVRRMTIAL